MSVLARGAKQSVAVSEGEKRKAHLAMLLFAMLIASSFSIGSQVVRHIDPAPLNALRFTLGAALMAAFTFGLNRQRFYVPAAPWRFLALGALMGTYFVTMFIALGITSAVSTSALFTLMPIITAVFSFFLIGQITRPVVGLSLLFAGIGSVWVIFRGDINALLSFDIGQGEAIFFIGVVCHALYVPLTRKIRLQEHVFVFTFYSLSATALCIGVFGVPGILQTAWTEIPLSIWGLILYLSIFPTAVTSFLLLFASTRLPAAKVLAYGYLTPVFVIFYEGMLGHGWVSPMVAAGALVICIGLAILYITSDG